MAIPVAPLLYCMREDSSACEGIACASLAAGPILASGQQLPAYFAELCKEDRCGLSGLPAEPPSSQVARPGWAKPSPSGSSERAARFVSGTLAPRHYRAPAMKLTPP